MRALVIDTETDGLTEDDNILEIAAALYDIKSKSVLWQYAALLGGLERNEAEYINHISVASLKAVARDTSDMPIEIVGQMLVDAEVVVAHNVAFDRKMIETHLKVKGRPVWTKPWVCSMEDIHYPKEAKSRKLIHLAADHGIYTGGAHRALDDVMMVVQLFQQTPDLEEQINVALKPSAIYAAVVSYDKREDAKSRGYSWNGTAKRWEKKLPIEGTSLRATPDRPFAVRRVG